MAGHDVATCYVSVEVLFKDASGSSRWVPCAQFTDMPDYIYCREELGKLLDAYGQFIAGYGVARRTEYRDVTRYRLKVRGAFSGRLVALQEWHWVGRRGMGMWLPDEPLLTWTKWSDLDDEQRAQVAKHIHMSDAPPGMRPNRPNPCHGCGRAA